MAEYKLICSADSQPSQMIQGPSIGTIQFQTGTAGQNCPGGGYWVPDTEIFQPLTIAEGTMLMGAIVGVWVAGWSARQIIRVIRR